MDKPIMVSSSHLEAFLEDRTHAEGHNVCLCLLGAQAWAGIMVHTVAPTLNVVLHANHMYSCHGEVVVLIFFHLFHRCAVI